MEPQTIIDKNTNIKSMILPFKRLNKLDYDLTYQNDIRLEIIKQYSIYVNELNLTYIHDEGLKEFLSRDYIQQKVHTLTLKSYYCKNISGKFNRSTKNTPIVSRILYLK